jgi:DNA-binding NarL/FixJ family response regulator
VPQEAPSGAQHGGGSGSPPEHEAGFTASPDGGLGEPEEPAPLRVVVADDNPVVRAGLRVLLSGREDLQVVADASDGREAYEVAQRYRPDVVLLDVRMPGVDGISALPYLTRLAPVMMLTYSREDAVVHEALRLGAGGYLVHGEFTADQLVGAVRDIKAGRPYFTASASSALLLYLRGSGEESGPGPRPPLPRGTDFADAPGGRAGAGSTSRHGEAAGPSPYTQGRSAPSAAERGHPGAPGGRRQPLHTSVSMRSEGRSAGGVPGSETLSSREREIMELIASGMNNTQIAATCFISEKTVKNHINRIFAKLQVTSRGEAVAVWLGTATGGAGGPA